MLSEVMLEIISNFLWEIRVLFLGDYLYFFHKNVLFSKEILKKSLEFLGGGGGVLRLRVFDRLGCAVF